MKKILTVAALITWTVGCGGANTYHCDFRTSEDPEDRCQERSNNIPGGGRVAQEAFKETCEAALGDGGDGPCPLDGAVAGCDYGQVGGETAIDWYYAPETMADIQTECDQDSGTVIDP